MGPSNPLARLGVRVDVLQRSLAPPARTVAKRARSCEGMRWGKNMASNIEEPAYDLVRSFPDFELRTYRPNVQARVQTGREGAPSGGFRRVARYIFGGNETGESIAMTAPVSMWEEGETGWLAFTMPSAYALDSLPAPHDAGVLLLEQAEKQVAVFSFSGRTTAGKTARIEQKLRKAITKEGFSPVGPAVLAVYENPWTTLPFMRRNELHLEIQGAMHQRDEKE